MSFIDFIPVLEINNLRIEDSGDYTCEANNDAGSASSSIKIVVKGQKCLSKYSQLTFRSLFVKKNCIAIHPVKLHIHTFYTN